MYQIVMASCSFSATARLFSIHQWPFKCWNYTQYADFHGHDAKPKITAHDPNQKVTYKVTVIRNTWLSYSASKCYNSAPAYIY